MIYYSVIDHKVENQAGYHCCKLAMCDEAMLQQTICFKYAGALPSNLLQASVQTLCHSITNSSVCADHHFRVAAVTRSPNR